MPGILGHVICLHLGVSAFHNDFVIFLEIITLNESIISKDGDGLIKTGTFFFSQVSDFAPDNL